MERMPEAQCADAVKAAAPKHTPKAQHAGPGFGADWSNLADAFNKAADANAATDASCGSRVVHSKRTRADDDENGEVQCFSSRIRDADFPQKFVKRPRFSGCGSTSGEHEFLTPSPEATDRGATYKEVSANKRGFASSVTVQKFGEDDERDSDVGASQPRPETIKGEYVEERGIKVEPPSDDALLYDDGGDKAFSTSIATSSPLRVPVWLQGRVEKVEGDLDGAGLLIGA